MALTLTSAPSSPLVLKPPSAPPSLLAWTGPPVVDPDAKQFRVLHETRELFDIFGRSLGLRGWTTPNLAAFAADDRIVAAQLNDPSLTLDALATQASASRYRAAAARDRYLLPYSHRREPTQLYPATEVLGKALSSDFKPRNIHEAVDLLSRRGIHSTAHTARRALTMLLNERLGELAKKSHYEDTELAIHLIHFRNPAWRPLAISARLLARGMVIFPDEIQRLLATPEPEVDPDRHLEKFRPGPATRPMRRAALILDSGYPEHDADVTDTIKRIDPDMDVVMLGAAPRHWGSPPDTRHWGTPPKTRRWGSGDHSELKPPYHDATVKERGDLDCVALVSMDPYRPASTKSVAAVVRDAAGDDIRLMSPFQAWAEGPAAELRTLLDLPGAPPELVAAADDKVFWREVVEAAGLPVWMQEESDTLDTERLVRMIYKVAKETGKRYVVLKPRHGAANFALEVVDTQGDPEKFLEQIAEHQKMMLAINTPADEMITLVCEYVGDAEAGGHSFGPEFTTVTMKNMRGPAIVGHSLDPRDKLRAKLEELAWEDERRILGTLGIHPSKNMGSNWDFRYYLSNLDERYLFDWQFRPGLMAPLYVGAAFGADVQRLHLRMHMGEDVSGEFAALQRQGPVAAMIYGKRHVDGWTAQKSVTERDGLLMLWRRRELRRPVVGIHGKRVERVFYYSWPGGVRAGQLIEPLDNRRYMSSANANAPYVGVVANRMQTAQSIWQHATNLLGEVAGLQPVS